MIRYLLLAVPLALIWMLITGVMTLESAALGYVFGVAGLVVGRLPRNSIKLQHFSDRVLAASIFIVSLLGELVRTSIDLVRRVLSPDMGLRPGVLAVPVGDGERSDTLSAYAVVAVTLPPGEMVIDLQPDPVTGEQIMFVHCLDVVASERTIYRDEARRLKLLRRIAGRDQI